MPRAKGKADIRELRVERLTQAAFAPFGDVIERAPRAAMTVNDGTARAWRDLARIEAKGRGARVRFSLVRAVPTPFPLRVETMECHPLGSQAFWPLDGAQFLTIVAAPGRFDPDRLRAFLCRAGQGINLRPGTWHHALVALGRPSDFVVIDRAGAGTNIKMIELARPWIVRRAGQKG